MEARTKEHVFPFLQKFSAAFLAAGGAAFISNKAATTIMLMASGSQETINDNYLLFDNLTLFSSPDKSTWSVPGIKLMLKGLAGWDASETVINQVDKSKWKVHNLKLLVSFSNAPSDKDVERAVDYARFSVCALAVAEALDDVIKSVDSKIKYQIATAEEVAAEVASREDRRKRDEIESEIRTAVDYVRKGLRVEGKAVTLPKALLPLALAGSERQYFVSFNDYGGKVVRKYEVFIPPGGSILNPCVRRIA